MVTGHFRRQLAHSTVESNISIFSVHVMESSSRLISQDDSVVSDAVGLSFKNFSNVNFLSVGLFETVDFFKLVPISN